MIETTLAAVLAADPAVAALVGVRIEAMDRLQGGALPAVVYQRVGSVPEATIKGDAGLDAVRVQVSCWAATFGGARNLAVAVRAAIVGSPLLRARTVMEMDDRDPVTRDYRVIQDFRIWQ